MAEAQAISERASTTSLFEGDSPHVSRGTKFHLGGDWWAAWAEGVGLSTGGQIWHTGTHLLSSGEIVFSRSKAAMPMAPVMCNLVRDHSGNRNLRNVGIEEEVVGNFEPLAADANMSTAQPLVAISAFIVEGVGTLDDGLTRSPKLV
jgi:hypothetical protein